MKTMKKITAVLSSLVLLGSMAAVQAGAAYTETYQHGDLNQDGIIDCRDLVLFKKGLFHLTPLTDVQKKIADINQDGYVNLTDLSLLKLHCAGIKNIDSNVVITYDENGNAVALLNNNENLLVSSNGFTAQITNTATQSLTEVSRNALSWHNADDTANTFLSAWNSELKYQSNTANAILNISPYYTAVKTVYSDTAINTGFSGWGNININHDAIKQDNAPFMRNTANYFSNANSNDALFADSSYGVDDTIALVNAEVTKRENGIEFVNHVSNDTVYSFMADDYVTIDDVKISYADGKFTVEGIADENIALLHTMTVGQYDEIAVMTNTPGNRLIYGLMFDTASQSMAALVKVRVDQNMEATVIQYSKPADMATTINFYPKDYVFETAMNDPDQMVTLFDNDYDPDHLVFQTVHFPRKTKNTLAGSLNARYQITNGFTFKQTAGANSIKTTYENTAQTLAFNQADAGFTLSTTENGYTLSAVSDGTTSIYTNGNEAFALTGNYQPNAEVIYTSDGISEAFTPNAVLAQHSPVLY